MYHFKRLATEVNAVQVGDNGIVMVGDQQLIGSPGFWVVIDRHGTQTNWSDEQFRQYFEPADREAETYLSQTPRKDASL